MEAVSTFLQLYQVEIQEKNSKISFKKPINTDINTSNIHISTSVPGVVAQGTKTAMEA